MSGDDELQQLRQKRLMEMQKQAAAQQQQASAQQQQDMQLQSQINAIMGAILSSDARLRLQNLKMAKPEFAKSIEMQLIQLYQKGTLQRSFNLPLNDEDFKNILIKTQQKKKRDTKIRII